MPEPMIPWEFILGMIERNINDNQEKLLTTLKEQVAVREAQAKALKKAIERIENGPPTTQVPSD